MKAFFIFLFLIVAGFFANYRMDGFSTKKIASSFPINLSFDLALTPDREVLTILEQKFTYLGSGRQCFAFQSEDGKYVIKFLNHDRFSLPKLLQIFPLFPPLEAMRKKRMEKRHKRIEAFFTSFALAYTQLKEESGLLFVQLVPKDHFTQPILLIDRIGYPHTVDLNKMEFILQKKGVPLYEVLAGHAGNTEVIKKILHSFIQLIVNRISKNIIDDDLNVKGNIGILDGKAILMDIGRLFIDETLQDPEKFNRELLKSIKFLRQDHPELLSLLEEELDWKHSEKKPCFLQNF